MSVFGLMHFGCFRECTIRGSLIRNRFLEGFNVAQRATMLLLCLIDHYEIVVEKAMNRDCPPGIKDPD